jgi:hypothetical protein
MPRIVEYTLATSDDDESEVTQKVNELIAQGFQPLGGVSVTTTREAYVCYAQAMVRYEGVADASE